MKELVTGKDLELDIVTKNVQRTLTLSNFKYH